MINKTLYFGDNLDILKDKIPDNFVDLIYLDPPFQSGRNYNIIFQPKVSEIIKGANAEIKTFGDTWEWGMEAEKNYEGLVSGIITKEKPNQKLIDLMKTMRSYLSECPVMAYLSMMAPRLLEMRRVLKNTGSIYLHCDPTASHYLKLLMDAIFGVDNFRNEIVWFYKDPSGQTTNFFRRKHDIIFFYSKTDNYNFLADFVRVPYAESTQKQIEKGVVSFGRPSKGNSLGKVPEDVWEIPIINSQAKERLGYPTQKPVKLLERILKASTPKKGIVLDPFCGCGTTLSSCEFLNHNEGYDLTWLGIDVTHLAINLMKWRLKNEFDLEQKTDYKVTGEPVDLTGAKELANNVDRFQFQYWALSLVNARPYSDKIKGADTGIDGYIYFIDPNNPKIPKTAIVQVKSGHVSVKDIRDLKAVVEREKAVIGLFITLEEPTKQMLEEAIKTGFYKKEMLKIQIITIKKLLEGKRPNIPPFLLEYRKTANKVKLEAITPNLF